MQIEPRPLPLSPLSTTLNTAAAEASGFQDILARVQHDAPAQRPGAATDPAAAPLYLPMNPPLDEKANDTQLQKSALDEDLQEEAQEAELEQELELELEWRDETLDEYYEDQLREESLKHEESGISEQEGHSNGQEAGSEQAEGAEGDGGEGEISSDNEEIPLPELTASGDSDEGSVRLGWAAAAPSVSTQERPLNYEEIQHLVNTILNSGQKLPHQVRHILQDLLNALLDGQRQLLDQHRLVGLEPEEYTLILKLFPPHFYAGWPRQERQRGQQLPLYGIMQDLFVQSPPDAARKEELLSLLAYSFDPLPLPLRNWVLDQPPLLEDRELINLLEVWQQQQALPPGATGQLLNLAQTYQHHPETMRALFSLSQACLHQRPLSEDQIDLLAQKLYERCFPPLADAQQTQVILKEVLQGREPDHEGLMRLLLGSAQAVLSYLPYAYLHPALQEIQDYVRRDLFGQEAMLPELFREEAAAKMA
ncbi:MAG: hypothetical protein IGS03_02490 [Candidatus Sericytochromatia bacterium]|nr:hypothetical protein [Candidatus Sericytochromatia bacterium]